MYVFFSPPRLSEKFLILRIILCNRHSCQIVIKLNFSQQICEKHLKYQISWENRKVGAELFHSDRRTDRETDVTKLIVIFRNLANAPKM